MLAGTDAKEEKTIQNGQKRTKQHKDGTAESESANWADSHAGTMRLAAGGWGKGFGSRRKAANIPYHDIPMGRLADLPMLFQPVAG